MATIGASFVDLIDVYKQTDANGNMVDVIDMLHKMNPVMQDAITVEANLGTRHRTTIRTGLPPVAWGKLYQGIPNGKGGFAQVEDTTGFVEGLSTVDERLLELTNNPAAIRLSEAKGFLEAMSQEMQTKFFYGNTAADPEQFLGLSPRFNSLSAPNGIQIVDAGGTGSDNMSIWFVTWADNAVHLLYPKGTQAGVERQDKGSQRVLDGNGNPYYAKEELFRQHLGLTVRDWRYVTRIANIDASDLAAGSVALYNFMRKAYYKHEGRRTSMGKTVIYMNKDAMEALDVISTNGGAADNFIRLTTTQIEGKEIRGYRGMTIRETDALLKTEARVI